jgi:hypothetical protein
MLGWCVSSTFGQRAGALVLLALALGCELTRELGVYVALEDETSTSLDADTRSDDTEGSSSGETGSGGGETETGDETGETGDEEPGDGDGDLDDPCKIDGSEDPCEVCLEFLCCEFISNCNSDSGCNCMLDCLMQTDAVTCAMSCAPGPAYFQLFQCQALNCSGVCN